MSLSYSNPAFFAEFFKNSELKPYLFLLAKKMEEGNVCLDMKDLQRTSEDYEWIKEQHAELSNSLPENDLWNDGTSAEITPFVLQNDKLYTRRMFQYEQSFIQGIKRFLENSNCEEKKNNLLNNKVFSDFTKSLFKNHSKPDKVNWQMVACITAYLYNFSIITGGPGTGKTTVVAKLLSLLIKESGDKPLHIKLVAPTGKAKSRMKESLGQIEETFKDQKIEIDSNILTEIKTLEPTTIHRLLGYQRDSIYFKHNKSNFLDADIIVVDECSMVDISLFSKLMEAIDPTRTKLILLGDRNQLPSVEAGSLFGDLCLSGAAGENYFPNEQVEFFNKLFPENSKKIEDKTAPNLNSLLLGHIVELKESYRFGDDKGIGKFSKALLEGEADYVESCFKDGVIVLYEDAGQALKKEGDKNVDWKDFFIKKMIDKNDSYISEKEITQALVSLNDYKILCAHRKGDLGVEAMNEQVDLKMRKLNELKVNGKEDSEDLQYEYYENQVLMVTTNQPELDISNGDIGIVRKTPNGTLDLYFSQEHHLQPWLIQSVENAYALTIHKSQGSEFDHVLIMIPKEGENQFLTKELLYTAVTRAKKSVIIMGDKDSILKAVKNSIPRISGIAEQLNSQL